MAQPTPRITQSDANPRILGGAPAQEVVPQHRRSGSLGATTCRQSVGCPSRSGPDPYASNGFR